jgi:hypothetical protein
MKNTIDRIAKEHLRLETLETRRRDSLDFHDLPVWCIRKALEEAYNAGARAAQPGRDLLEASLYAMNVIPNQRIDHADYRNTYKLAAAIARHLKDGGEP